ncbi:MAG: right-handed parallel beta-helix repeat-containing protein [Candidatus Aureabacteria bacterium]|nr:right-handed parallel beta-helix repeat-containing protein [Candidatus Auribacterota bacterium]
MRTLILTFMGIAIVIACSSAGMSNEAQTTAVLQDQIDKALLGDVIPVPEGTYQGKLVLKNGIALVGAEGGGTIIDGSGLDSTIVGSPDTVLSNLTIVGGKAGVDTRGSFMGIFDCRFKNSKPMAIHVPGGSAVIVNNLIIGGSISCNSSNPMIISNTLAPGGVDGIWTWYAPGPTAVNNLITGASWAVGAGAGSTPKLENNAYWANKKDVEGCAPDAHPLCTDPIFIDTVDYRLDPSSPLIGTGITVAGIWEDVKPDMGRNAGKRFSVEECRTIMNNAVAAVEANGPSLTYTLGETLGEFLVTVNYPRKNFSIRSSTPETEVTNVEAFDKKGEESLIAELVKELFPRVSVKGGESTPAPTPTPEVVASPGPEEANSVNNTDTEKDSKESDNRYTLRNIYKNAGSYYEGDNGLRVFKRKTNIHKVTIEIPDGYKPKYALRDGVPIEGELSAPIEIRVPGIKEIEIGMEKIQEPSQEPGVTAETSATVEKSVATVEK